MELNPDGRKGVAGRPQRPSGRSWLVLVAAAVALPATGVAAVRQAPADPSPATGDARVIAQGVAAVGPGEVVWQVSRGVAQTPANAAPIDAETGFLIADDGAILVEDDGGSQVRLASGEATVTEAGERQIRAALGPNASDYWSIELLDGAGGEGTGAGEPTFTGAAFEGPGSRHDLDLVGTTLDAGEVLEIPAGAVPTLVLVLSGSADVDVDGTEAVTLAAGEAATVDGGISLSGLDEGADVAVAVVGPAVPRLGTGADATPIPADEREGNESAPVATIGAREDDEELGDQTPVSEETAVAEETPVAEVTPAVEAQAAAETPTAVAETESVVSEEPALSADTAAEVDTDGDGLTDAVEIDLNTDPAVADTDGDGLTDGQEANVNATLPLTPDTDGDGVVDGDEIAAGTDPFDGGTVAPALATVAEPVGEEGAVDSDGDGLNDAFELELGIDPSSADTDGDGLSDGEEYTAYQTGLQNPDSDGDGVLDGDEALNGTNPNDPNSF